jgi:hypothetical protein
MLFKDLPVVDMKDAIKAISGAKGIVFVSAKGVQGINMPLKSKRELVTKSMTSEIAFVPVTDSWKVATDVLAKDFALQLKADAKSPYPLILSIGKDRYEKFSEKELNPAFEGNALVVLHAAPNDKKLDEIRAFHHKTREILGEAKEIKVFPEHILTVTEIVKKLPKTPKVFLDAGAGFMIFDQAKHYLDTGVVSEVITLNVTLAKSEKMTIPYVYDNADMMGIAEDKNSFVKVIRKGPPGVGEGLGEVDAAETGEPAKPKSSKPKSKDKKSASKK